MRRLPIVLAAILFGLSIAAAGADAEIAPVQLISKTPLEQADEASQAAVSANGAFVAFRGSIGGQTGVFREEVASGAIVPVATGSAYVLEAPGSDAAEPSISADGRYVSFTTAAPLDPVDDEAPGAGGAAPDLDVYVADMSTTPPTYALASARNGSREGLGYAEPERGAAASGRVALSADGREVAFYTRSASDLVGAVDKAEAPTGQIALRNLATDTTTLVSVERDPLTGEMDPEVPVPGGAFVENRHEGAALSADGSTVAWLSVHLVGQVPLLPDEQAQIEAGEGLPELSYDEPLWRRVGEGPGAPTRRVIGGGDPTAPGCPPGSGLAVEACQGPFPALSTKSVENGSNRGWVGTAGVDGLPQLSDNGQVVALLGNPTVQESNLFTVDMAEGLSRRQAVKQWTFEVPAHSASADQTNIPGDGDLYNLSLDGAGDEVAFTTARQQFPGGAVSLFGSAPSALGLQEVYLLNLENGSLQRVTHGDRGISEPSLAKGEAANRSTAGAGSVALDEKGDLVAFASTASNLVPGDANDESDVFIDNIAEKPGTVGHSQISPPPSFAIRAPRWQMTLSARSLPNGRVRLTAIVPGAGSLRAKVAASLAVGKAARNVGKADKRARSAGATALTLKLPARLRRLARTKAGLYALARVTFRGPGGGPLHGKLEVRFHAHPPSRHKPKGKKA
jgi:hypothetical protein